MTGTALVASLVVAAVVGATVALFVAWPIAYHAGAALGRYRAYKNRGFTPIYIDSTTGMPPVATESEPRSEKAA